MLNSLFILSLCAAGEPAVEEPAIPKETPPVVADGRSPIDAVQGHLGLGYFTGFAPLGVRYWTSRDMAFDVGLDGALSSGGLESYRFALELGGLTSLGHWHYSVVFARLGVGFRVNDTFGEHSTPARYDVVLNGFLGAEMFLGALGFPNVSLQGGYGLQASWALRGGTKFLVGAASAGLDINGTGLLGFHIYM
jgi:hypothetical protein